MESILDQLGQIRPFLDWLNFNYAIVLTPLYLFLYTRTLNIFALIIVLETVINYFLINFLLPVNVFLFLCSQFTLFATFILFTKRSPLICFSYIVLFFYFCIQCVIDSFFIIKSLEYDLNQTLENYYKYEVFYNAKEISFYFYHLVVVLAVNALMIKGLFHKSGGRKHGYDHSSYNAIHVDEHGFYNNMRRLSKSFSRSVKRVIQK